MLNRGQSRDNRTAAAAEGQRTIKLVLVTIPLCLVLRISEGASTAPSEASP